MINHPMSRCGCEPEIAKLTADNARKNEMLSTYLIKALDSRKQIADLMADNDRLTNLLDRIKAHHMCHDCDNYQKETSTSCCDPTIRMILEAEK